MDFFLRPWQRTDVASLTRYANHPRVAQNLRDSFPHPYTVEDAQAYVSSCLAGDETRQLLRAIEINGEAVGSIGLFLGGDIYRKSAELGYWLAEPYWGKGIMSRAVTALCRESFARWDIVRIYAEPFAHNSGSRRVLEKAGFVLEGIMRQGAFKNGQVIDYCMYGKVR